MKEFMVFFNGHGNGYINELANIKDGLYELFGNVPVATDMTVMEGVVEGLHIKIHQLKR